MRRGGGRQCGQGLAPLTPSLGSALPHRWAEEDIHRGVIPQQNEHLGPVLTAPQTGGEHLRCSIPAKAPTERESQAVRGERLLSQLQGPEGLWEGCGEKPRKAHRTGT